MEISQRWGCNGKKSSSKKTKINGRDQLAFKAESTDEVDRLYPLIKNVGADIVKPPQYYPQHGGNYYALFFKDLEGIKYEIVYEGRD